MICTLKQLCHAGEGYITFGRMHRSSVALAKCACKGRVRVCIMCYGDHSLLPALKPWAHPVAAHTVLDGARTHIFYSLSSSCKNALHCP